MTNTYKQKVIKLIERRIKHLKQSIIEDEQRKQKVIEKPQYYEHPAKQITWHNKRIKQFETELNELNEALKEIDQI